MSKYEYICKDCEVVYIIEKTADRKSDSSVCPHCHGVLEYTGAIISEDKKEKPKNVVSLAEMRLRKKGI